MLLLKFKPISSSCGASSGSVLIWNAYFSWTNPFPVHTMLHNIVFSVSKRFYEYCWHFKPQVFVLIIAHHLHCKCATAAIRLHSYYNQQSIFVIARLLYVVDCFIDYNLSVLGLSCHKQCRRGVSELTGVFSITYYCWLNLSLLKCASLSYARLLQRTSSWRHRTRTWAPARIDKAMGHHPQTIPARSAICL